jgi:hypothetical protein
MARSESAASGEGMIDNEHNDRTNDCDQKTPSIEAGYAHAARRVENEASNDGSNYAKHDIKQDALALRVDNLARDKARY